MPLLGTAAMLLSFDVETAAVADHDHWHTVEHLPERLSIPGFLRGTRWVACASGPRYLVLYEVERIDVLSSPPYRERLDHPSDWTRRVMPTYRGMVRSLCQVRASVGCGLGGVAAVRTFDSRSLPLLDARDALLPASLAALVQRPGLGSVHWLQTAATAAMTGEQQLRGADRAVAAALILTGYDEAAVMAATEALAGREVEPPAPHDTVAMPWTLYRQHHSLARAELDALAAQAPRSNRM